MVHVEIPVSLLVSEGLPGAMWAVFHIMKTADEEMSLVLFRV